MDWKLSDKAYKLREDFFEKYGKNPRGWDWEGESMEEYEQYLEKELSKSDWIKKLLDNIIIICYNISNL